MLRKWALGPIIFLWCMALVACGGGPYCSACPPVHGPIAIPGTHTLPEIPQLLASETNYTSAGWLSSYTASDATTHLIILLNSNLYTLPLGSNSVQQIAHVSCGGAPALSPDRHIVACPNALPASFTNSANGSNCQPFCAASTIHIFTLTSETESTEQTQVGLTNSSDLYISPTWAPDSRHVALIHHLPNNTCSIDFYRVQLLPTTTVTLAGIMQLSAFKICDLRQIAWSPDGRSLALLAGNVVSGSHQLWLVSLAHLPPSVFSAQAHPHSFTMTPMLLEQMPNDTNANSAVITTVSMIFFWTPDSRALTLLTTTNLLETRISQLDLASREETVVFPKIGISSDKGYSILAATWTPDGHSLIFAADFWGTNPTAYQADSQTRSAQTTGICACPHPPDALYLYTPYTPSG